MTVSVMGKVEGEQAELKRCTELSLWGTGRLSTITPVLTHLFLTLT